MQDVTQTFYKYLSLHSLLIGVFPFFLPVYLWNQEFTVAQISIFIGVSGLAFSPALWVWDHIRQSVELLRLIGISLVLELILLLTVKALPLGWTGLILLGICYGSYNCFFWSTQRALFFERVNSINSGRSYGNMQMYVGLVLQMGILIGGLLLENLGFNTVLICSAFVCAIGYYVLARNNSGMPDALKQLAPLSLKEVVSFKDTHSSKLIFVIDGFYLFLESFFWVISLFLIAHESFVTLGLMVMSLAIIFGIMFYLLKNIIDRLDRWRIYRIAVGLYALSWVIRAVVTEEMQLISLFVALVLITFCTSFFRLAMNKRFYDLARETLNHRYLVLKSYYSQLAIGVMFISFGVLINGEIGTEQLMSLLYWIAALIALCFLAYGAEYAKVERLAAKVVHPELVGDSFSQEI